MKFTALLHHLTIDRLRDAYLALQRRAAPGVDGVTWAAYGEDLEARLADLHARVHGGAYRARPSRRVYIPKPDGRERPLGIASVEDKIVQRAAVEARSRAPVTVVRARRRWSRARGRVREPLVYHGHHGPTEQAGVALGVGRGPRGRRRARPSSRG
ncbi:Retron-type RNA-directed DNA polymerase [Minicystis rosea]|nr:Retron-type RNA-directed DNA polymerase [Minicystis rosea]